MKVMSADADHDCVRATTGMERFSACRQASSYTRRSSLKPLLRRDQCVVSHRQKYAQHFAAFDLRRTGKKWRRYAAQLRKEYSDVEQNLGALLACCSTQCICVIRDSVVSDRHALLLLARCLRSRLRGIVRSKKALAALCARPSLV